MNVTYFDFNALTKINATPEYYERLRWSLKIKKIVGKNFVRLGKENDGGYIMVDNFQSNGGIAYSFGLNDDVSWDSDMAARGYEIFMYDPTIDGLPQENERFHFFKAGIGGAENAKRHLNTLEHFIAANGHADKSNMILKMDVDGAEWNFLKSVSSETLNKFDQIVFEFHSVIRPRTQDKTNAVVAAVEKINRTHSLVHLHPNNYDAFLILDDKILFPSTFELTYVKTSNYELVDDENIFLPIPLDQPNAKGRPEIPLGFWNRRYNNVVTFK